MSDPQHSNYSGGTSNSKKESRMQLNPQSEESKISCIWDPDTMDLAAPASHDEHAQLPSVTFMIMSVKKLKQLARDCWC